jgi:hypothetical protein
MATTKELNVLGYLTRSSLILMKWVKAISATYIFNLFIIRSVPKFTVQ